MSEPAPRGKGWFDGPAGLALVVLGVAVGAAVLETLSRPTDGQATPPRPLPPLLVEGWLNTAGGPGPSVEGLRGDWVVLDSWATFCGPCLHSMPKLAELNRRWRDKGLRVVGLTSEPESLVPQIEAVIARVDGFDWPVGYGAGLVQDQLGVTAIPTYTLFDPTGTSVWSGHTVEGLEQALRDAGAG